MAQDNKKDIEQTEDKSAGRRPDYSGDGVAVWVNTDKNGNAYLAIKILNSFTVRAFPQKEVA